MRAGARGRSAAAGDPAAEVRASGVCGPGAPSVSGAAFGAPGLAAGAGGGGAAGSEGAAEAGPGGRPRSAGAARSGTSRRPVLPAPAAGARPGVSGAERGAQAGPGPGRRGCARCALGAIEHKRERERRPSCSETAGVQLLPCRRVAAVLSPASSLSLYLLKNMTIRFER